MKRGIGYFIGDIVKGNLKGDRGRWYGPGQVVVNESQKVIWISHAGYLIRASPQQVRPASLQEFRTLQRGPEGKIDAPQVNSQCRNFVDLSAESPAEDHPEQNEPQADVPEVPMSTTNSQPDGEMFPPDLASNGYTPTSPAGSIRGDEVVEVPMDGDEKKEAHEIPVPVDGEDSWFGDDVTCVTGDAGYWEICFGNGPELGLDADCDTNFYENPELGEWLLMATDTRKQKVEIQWNTLRKGKVPTG